jgi:hypothetical protein
MRGTDLTVGMMVFVSALSGVMACFSLLVALLGFAQIRDPQSGFVWGKRQRAEILHKWIPSLRWAHPWLQIDLFNQATRLNGWALCGAGVGLAAGFVGLGAIGLALSEFNGFGTLEILVILELPCATLPAALGAALGFKFGARALRRGHQAPAASAWEPRRVADYRAAWLDGTFALIALIIAIACAIIAIRFPQLAFAFLNPPDAPAPPALPALVFIAAFALLGPVVSWLAARWIAAAPPVITTPYSGIANDAEDYVRAQIIAYTIPFTWRSCGWLMMSLGMVVTQTLVLDDTGPGALGFGLGMLFLLLGFVVLMLGSLVGLLRGRMGGRRVGWPWRPRLTGVQAVA